MERVAKILILLLITAHTTCIHAADWTVGILALRGEKETLRHWQPLVDSLDSAVTGAHFHLLPLDLNGMREAVNNGTIQFVLTNQAQFVQLNSSFHLRWLASLRSDTSVNSMAAGSAILVRQDSPFHHAPDLAGKTLGAVDEQAFGGYLLGYRELIDAGLQVDEQANIRFVGFPADALLYLLRENVVQAAIVPVCLLENMDREGLINKNLFRALLEKETSFPCMTSTALYPDWSFAAMPGVDDKIADAVARDLLIATQTSALRWGAPASTRQTESLLREVNRHPEQQRFWQNLVDWLHQHKIALGTIVLLAILLIANYAWVMMLVKKRGKRLDAVNQKLRKQQHALEQARQMSVLGEMASGFAHELNQPLSAIRMYAQGGMNYLSRDTNNITLEKALTHIELQAERCGLIIKHLREWANPSEPGREVVSSSPVDVTHTIRHVLALLQLNNDSPRIKIHINSAQGCMLFLPPVLLEQVLANVILNAVQAGASQLWFDFRSEGKKKCIILQDDAGGISSEQFSDLFVPFHSSKQAGMGLGLVICQRLLRKVNSDISVRNDYAPDGSAGAVVTLTFPDDEQNGIAQ
ncbi:tetrathionate respiration histidine kinase TtrS [Klebsiella pneumoniae]|nr:PhnD/SsuA/transferrin family substrate-binding protein [Klebsiella pneumoniae]